MPALDGRDGTPSTGTTPVSSPTESTPANPELGHWAWPGGLPVPWYGRVDSTELGPSRASGPWLKWGWRLGVTPGRCRAASPTLGVPCGHARRTSNVPYMCQERRGLFLASCRWACTAASFVTCGLWVAGVRYSLAFIPKKHTSDTLLESRTSSADLSGPQMTIVAIILIVGGFLFIAGGIVFAWAIRRRRPASSPASFYKFLTHRSRASDDAISIASWNDGYAYDHRYTHRDRGRDTSTALWSHGKAPTKPERAYTTEPQPDYIPYNGPVEPPRLPLPMALRALVNRPLPPLPGEERAREPEPQSDLMGALLLRLGSRKGRKTAAPPAPNPAVAEVGSSRATSQATLIPRHGSSSSGPAPRNESILSDTRLITAESSLLHCTTTATSTALNARRSAAKVLHYDADGLSRPASSRMSRSTLGRPPSLPPPPVPHLPGLQAKTKRRSSAMAEIITSNSSPYHKLSGSGDSFNSILNEYPSPPCASPAERRAAPPPPTRPQTMPLARALSATIPPSALADLKAPTNVISGVPKRRSAPLPHTQGPTILSPPLRPIPSPSVPIPALAIPTPPPPVHRSKSTKDMHTAYQDGDPRVNPFADPGAENTRSPTR